VVLAFNVLHLVEDLGAALAQIRALLRPGGLFIAKTALIRVAAVIPLALHHGG